MGVDRQGHLRPVPLRLDATTVDGAAVDGAAVDGAVVRLAVGGEVDLATVGQLADMMSCIVRDQRPSRLIVDLAEVGFLDSTGIGALVAGYRLAGANGVAFEVAGCSPTVLRVLEITGVDKLLRSPDGPQP